MRANGDLLFSCAVMDPKGVAVYQDQIKGSPATHTFMHHTLIILYIRDCHWFAHVIRCLVLMFTVLDRSCICHTQSRGI